MRATAKSSNVVSWKVVWERKCVGRPSCARRLPNGTTVLLDTTEGMILVGRDGRRIRRLAQRARYGKLHLVPDVPAWREQFRQD